MDIGYLVKNIRKKNKWSQKQLAEIMNTTQSTISKLEKQKEPNSEWITTLKTISNLSGLTIDEILNGDKSNKNLNLGILKAKAEKLSDKQIKSLITFIDTLD